MTNECRKFIEFFDEMVNQLGITDSIPQEVKDYREKLISSSLKPRFTTTGLEIMEFLQANDQDFTSKQLSEKMVMSSRKISGAMRKLVNDGYIEKLGSSPVVYSLSEAGKAIDLKGENNEE